jgi:hypothetical protein
MKLNFTSRRDTKGYEIVGKMYFRRAGRGGFQEISPPDEVSSGRLEKPDAGLRGSGPWISGHIVGKGGKMQEVRLSDWPRAYEEFAKVKAAEDLLKFVVKYGPLTYEYGAANLIYYPQQVVLLLLDEAMQMRECMQGGIRGGEAKPYSHILSARLYKTKTGEMGIEMTPSSLLDALWLQFHDTESSGAVFRNCPYCKGPFAAGGNSGRRSIAEFCSEEHRKRFNSLARSDPKLRERRR